MVAIRRLDAFATGRHEQDASRHAMSDAVARGVKLADEIGASEFALFFIGPARDRGKLVPGFDSEYPALSAASTILSSTFGDAIVKRASASTAPSWWSGERGSLSTRNFDALNLAQQTALGLPDVPGIAFPVYAEGGMAGVIVFLGIAITLTDAALPELHARCFSLFGAAASMQPGELARLPAVSQRELDCLKLTANGYTSEEIAVVLGLSVHTTNQYLTKVTLKLNSVNRMHAVAKALRLGLIE